MGADSVASSGSLGGIVKSYTLQFCSLEPASLQLLGRSLLHLNLMVGMTRVRDAGTFYGLAPCFLTVTRHLASSKVKKKEIQLGSQFQHIIRWGWGWQELEAAPYTLLKVKNQKAMSICTQLAFSFLFSSTPGPWNGADNS